MAISISNLTEDNSTTDATSFNTASVAPTNGNLVLVTVTGVSAGTNVNPTLSGHSLTWDAVVTAGGDGTDVVGRVTRTFRAISDGTSGALTIDWGVTTQVRCFWSVEEVTGHATGSNGANAIGTTANSVRNNGGGAITTYSLNISPSFSTSGLYGAIHNSAVTAITAGTGYTELSDTTVDTQVQQTQWRATTDTNSDWSFASADAAITAVAVELKIPGSTLSDTQGYFLA